MLRDAYKSHKQIAPVNLPPSTFVNQQAWHYRAYWVLLCSLAQSICETYVVIFSQIYRKLGRQVGRKTGAQESGQACRQIGKYIGRKVSMYVISSELDIWGEGMQISRNIGNSKDRQDEIQANRYVRRSGGRKVCRQERRQEERETERETDDRQIEDRQIGR